MWRHAEYVCTGRRGEVESRLNYGHDGKRFHATARCDSNRDSDAELLERLTPRYVESSC